MKMTRLDKARAALASMKAENAKLLPLREAVENAKRDGNTEAEAIAVMALRKALGFVAF